MNQRDHIAHMGRMEQALLFMNQNIRRKLKLEDVAAQVNYKPVYFREVFKDYFEMPYKEYYIKLKMRAAARYIQYERITVNIAKKFGYSDIRTFNKAFLAEIGMTPAQFLEEDPLVPDMPDRKELCGVPIRLELAKLDPFSIAGKPLYHTKKEKEFARLRDAAYALTCQERWQEDVQGTSYVGIWNYDEDDELFYLIGSGIDSAGTTPDGMIRQDIAGGQYAIFSAEKTSDWQKNAEISRMMARYALIEWRYINMKETNQLGFTFEMFDEDRLYLYVPLLGDFGNNKHWRTSMQASLYREHIDSHITENIKTSEYAKKVHYTDRWLRDSFRKLFGVTPHHYIEGKRLKLAAKEILEGEQERGDILKKYQFHSFSTFSKKFISYYGQPYDHYEEPQISLPETLEAGYGTSRKIKVSVINLPRLQVALHPLSDTPEYIDVGDYPGLVTYWFTHDWEYAHRGYYNLSRGDKTKIFIYNIHLFEKNVTDADNYSIGYVLGEDWEGALLPSAPEGYLVKTIQGGLYMQCEIEEPYAPKDLQDIYQQMEASIFLKWYYENQLIISTTKEKLVRWYKGKMQFLIPLEL